MLRVLFASLLCALVQCMDYHLCGINNISCSYQLWPNNSNTCEMQYFPIDSEECFSEFPETPTRNTPQYGMIKIEPFMAYKERRTVFRTTAYNITWNNLKIRFKQQNSNKCMKRKFIIKEPQSIAKEKYLIYDCPFANSAYEGRHLEFEYSYGLGEKFDGKRTFLVEVPLSDSLKNYNATNLKNLKLFTYIETTDLYHLIYKIHKAPQINVPFYEIYVNFTKNNYTRTEGPFVKSAELAILGVIDFEFDTFGVPGDYVFFVRPYECFYCEFSTSSTLNIPDSSTILTIGIVGVSCLIPVLMITLYMYVKIDSGLKPRVLLVTTPSNDVHKTITTSLAKLLREKYNIPTKLDILDIPLNPNIDPQEWLETSYEYATHIVILISDHKPTTSIYRNMDKILFSIKQDPNKTTCSIVFPFTEAPTTKFKVDRKFKFMRDYTSFINFILNRSILRRIKDKFILKNDLYYCLVKDVENYANNLVIQPCLNSCDIECDENEQNCLKVDDVELEIDERQVPLDIMEKAEELLNKNCNSDVDSDDSDSDVSVDPYVLSLLSNLP